MKHTLLPALLLLVSQSLVAQVEFAPPGAEWHYRYISYWANIDAYAVVRYTGDTLLDGRPCKQIWTTLVNGANDGALESSHSSVQYIYQRADTVFEYRPAPTGTSEMLFRTGLQVRDTFRNEIGYQFEVVAVDTVYSGNIAVAHYTMRDIPFGNFVREIYDRFGPGTGFYDPYTGMIADGTELYLRCYSDNNFPLLKLVSVPCDTIRSRKMPDFNTWLYPNPVDDVIYLETYDHLVGGSTIYIWNTLGQLVHEERIPAEFWDQRIDVRHLPAGFYELVIWAQNSIIHQKFIKN